MEILKARWSSADHEYAVELIEVVLDVFEDKKQGGFYFTSSDHETLIQRPKVLMDESIPAGNGVAAFVLQRLGHLLGETRYLDAAEKTLKAAWDNILRTPYAHNTLLDAVEEYLYPPQTIIVRTKQEGIQQWLDSSAAIYAPRRFMVAIPDTARGLPGLLNQRSTQGEFVAYVCDGHQCRPAIAEVENFKSLLQSGADTQP